MVELDKRVSAVCKGFSFGKWKPNRRVPNAERFEVGRPLSPFLFILAGESLHVMMEEAVNQELFTLILVGNDKTILSHLQFTDDATFYNEWSIENARSLLAILNALNLPQAFKSILKR